MQQRRFRQLLKYGVLCGAISAIVAYEFYLAFGNRKLERIGARVAHTTLVFAGEQQDGYLVEFEEAVTAEQLREALPALLRLRKLRVVMSELSIEDATLSVLRGAENIFQLNVASTQITDQSAATIATMPNLISLNLARCKISDKGLAALKPLARLQKLNLVGTNVTDAGLNQLQSFGALREVSVGWGRVTPEGVEAAQSRLTNVILTRVGPPYEDKYAAIRVTETNGAPLPAEGGPALDVCRRYFRAWQEKDVFTLKALFVNSENTRFGDAGDEYRAIRPQRIEAYSGFINPAAATLIVAGPSEEYDWVKYKVQLRCVDDQWRIEHSQMLIE